MKIALFSRSVYPRSGGSSFVTEGLLKNFARDELFVIGGKDIFFFQKMNRSPETPSVFYLPSQLSLAGRGERFLQFFRAFLFPINFFHALLIIRKEKPDIIVCVFPDAYFCWLGLICARILRKPYFTYFHNTYAENRKGYKRAVAKYFQQHLFENSRLIFLMSDGLRRFYEKAYPGVHKFRTLVHTHQSPVSRQMQRMESRSSDWNVAFTGNFNESNLESTIRVVNALKHVQGVKLNFYTPVPKALLKIRGLDVDAIQYLGYLPIEDYRSSLANNDIMMLTHGFTGGYSTVEYETIFPTRTIELLITGKPIFAHAPANSFLASFLTEHQCASLVTEASEEVIRSKFQALCYDAKYRESLCVSGQAAAKIFYGPDVVAAWRQQINASLYQ